MLARIGVAEFIGTFVLVFGAVGAAVIAGAVIGNLGVAFAFGLALLAMAYAIGPITGCHINPAVTLGLLVSRKVSPQDAVVYWVAQILGAIAAAALLWAIAASQPGGYDLQEMGLGANGYGAHSPDGYPWGAAFGIEVVLTAFLVFTVLATTDRISHVHLAGIPIGLVLVLIHLIGIPVDNTSVNPARSIGPAVFVGDWALDQLWLFIVAPLIGGIVGAVIHMFLFSGRPVEPEGETGVAGTPS